MKMQQVAVLHGIKESKGTFEGREFSSTTFHLAVDVAENTSGRSIGTVTRPFKVPSAGEFEKWAHLKSSWPATGIPVQCEFDVVAGADNAVKLTLISIKPATVKA